MIDPMLTLRKLAKTDYYQSLYVNCKDRGLKMFRNDFDLTQLQLTFLSMCGIYEILNTDIYLGEVSERVLDNFIYEDAYLHYKRVSSSKDHKKNKSSVGINNSNNKQDKKEIVPKSSWSFRGKVR